MAPRGVPASPTSLAPHDPPETSMLSWLTRTLQSSIGKKAIMSLSGLALIGFLIAHLAGNLTFFADADGAAPVSQGSTAFRRAAITVPFIGC